MATESVGQDGRDGAGDLLKSFRKHDAIFLLMDGETGRLLDASAGALRFYGYSLAQIRSMNIDDINQLSHDEVDAERHKALAEQRSHFVFPHRLANGEVRTVEVHSTPVTVDGERCLFSVVHDVSDRVRVEDELRSSQERYRATFDGASVGIANVSADGVFLHVNQAQCDILGYTQQELVGMTFAEITHPDDVSGNVERLRRLFDGEGPSARIEKRYIRKDGEVVWVDLATAMVRKPDGSPDYLVTVIEDITDHKNAEEGLRRAQALAEKANRELYEALGRERDLARTDALTDVSNRRYWFELAEYEFEVARRYGNPLSVILFDIDRFKDINDRFGHAVGDRLIVRVAAIAKSELRAADALGRYGGDEFVIVLPMTNAEQARLIAERIRVGVDSIRVDAPGGPVHVTSSIGIAEAQLTVAEEAPGVDDALDRLVDRADRAMYEAKSTGRNRICVASSHL